MAAEIKINTDRCKGCYLCVNVCPKNALVRGTDFPNKSGYYAATQSDDEECIGCMSCALMCPDGAISLYKE